MWRPASDLEAYFLDEIGDDPVCGVYADWLEERGDEDRADFLRVHLRLRTMNVMDPRSVWLADRLAILSRVVDPTWRDYVLPVARVEPAPAPTVVAAPSVPPPPPTFRPSVEPPKTIWIPHEVPAWIRTASIVGSFTILLGFLLFYCR